MKNAFFKHLPPPEENHVRRGQMFSYTQFISNFGGGVQYSFA